MTDLETCRRHILSEDYRDFIGNHVRTPFFESIMRDGQCEQDAGFDYKCFYLPSELTGPISLARFSYNSIPKCFTPTSLETLNQTGILPVQNYPTLQLKGKGVLIGFLTAGSTTQMKSSAISTAPHGLQPSGIRRFRAERPRRVLPMVQNLQKRRSTKRLNRKSPLPCSLFR